MVDVNGLTWRIIISVRPFAFIPASSVVVESPCGSADSLMQPAKPCEARSPWGCASPITITNLRVPVRQPIGPSTAGVKLLWKTRLYASGASPPPPADRLLSAVCTSADDAVIDWTTWYSGESPASLNWITANSESGTEPWTPLTMFAASAFAASIDGCMLPVVSIASSMSAFGGLAGTSTVLVSVATPSVGSPARSVNVALEGERPAPVDAATASAVDKGDERREGPDR